MTFQLERKAKTKPLNLQPSLEGLEMQMTPIVIWSMLLVACGDEPPKPVDEPVEETVKVDGVRTDVYQALIEDLPSEEAKNGAIHVARGMQVMTTNPDDAEAVIAAAKQQTQGIECLSWSYEGSISALVNELQNMHMDTLENAKAMLRAQVHLKGMVSKSWSESDRELACDDEVLR